MVQHWRKYVAYNGDYIEWYLNTEKKLLHKLIEFERRMSIDKKCMPTFELLAVQPLYLQELH